MEDIKIGPYYILGQAKVPVLDQTGKYFIITCFTDEQGARNYHLSLGENFPPEENLPTLLTPETLQQIAERYQKSAQALRDNPLEEKLNYENLPPHDPRRFALSQEVLRKSFDDCARYHLERDDSKNFRDLRGWGYYQEEFDRVINDLLRRLSI